MLSKPLDILFIEDCEEDINLANEVLSERNIKNRMKIINDGEQAIHYLKDHNTAEFPSRPDVIILDLNLPKKNGFEVLKEITCREDLKKIPLIIFTTSNLDASTLQEYKLDLRNYVKKSVDFGEFVNAVQNIDKIRKAGRKAYKPQPNKGKDKLELLLIEDNIEDADYIKELLIMKEKGHWKITHCESLDEGFHHIDNKDFNIVVLDLFLPGIRGIQTLIEFVARNSSLPLVVMTGLKDERIGKQAIYEGAQDYLVKGQITSDRFVQSIEYAIERKKLEYMRDEILSYVNHELSNPLTVVKESISQIAEGILGDVNEKQAHFLKNALLNIDRLIRISEDLLLCAKLELGKLSIKKELFNFNQLVEEVTDNFEASFSQKNITLKKDLPTVPLMLTADRARIAQILTNLVGNALKCTDSGYVEIKVTHQAQELECRVSDTGIGIAEKDLPRLFKKYEQIMPQKGGGLKNGSGLGLFISKTLVCLHDGEIHVQSCLGKGTQMIFTLPLK